MSIYFYVFHLGLILLCFVNFIIIIITIIIIKNVYIAFIVHFKSVLVILLHHIKLTENEKCCLCNELK